jgi:two-component system phosphate regulon sensor histidine kinase PhoR
MLLQRRSLKEESLWLGLLALAAGLAVIAGADAAISAAVGLAAYALWHLGQLLRLLAFLKDNRDPGRGWVWGVWRDAFDGVRSTRQRERKRKRRQRRFLSRFRQVFAAMPDGVIIFGSGGEVSWVNPQARLYFGLGDVPVEDRRLVDLVDDQILLDYLAATDFRRVLELEAPGDPSVVLSISVTRLQNRRQQYLLVARDITRLHHLHQTKRDFSLNVSHELRTPLTVIQGYLETLSDAEDPQSPRWHPLSQMLQQTRRMQDVIRDLLTLSRLESGSEDVQRQSVVVFDMLEDIIDDAQHLAQETRHVVELAGDRGLVLLGDGSLLRSAFSNLIFNAVRHTPGRTRVSVTWGRDGSYADLRVRDDGLGIPARHLPRLTERFYRVDAGRSRDAGGSGLGLAIVRQILDVHDASLLISSEEGRGATFTCRFPPDRWTATPAEPQADGGVAAVRPTVAARGAERD